MKFLQGEKEDYETELRRHKRDADEFDVMVSRNDWQASSDLARDREIMIRNKKTDVSRTRTASSLSLDGRPSQKLHAELIAIDTHQLAAPIREAG
jgi:hypothetical protein